MPSLGLLTDMKTKLRESNPADNKTFVRKLLKIMIEKFRQDVLDKMEYFYHKKIKVTILHVINLIVNYLRTLHIC